MEIYLGKHRTYSFRNNYVCLHSRSLVYHNRAWQGAKPSKLKSCHCVSLKGFVWNIFVEQQPPNLPIDVTLPAALSYSFCIFHGVVFPCSIVRKEVHSFFSSIYKSSILSKIWTSKKAEDRDMSRWNAFVYMNIGIHNEFKIMFAFFFLLVCSALKFMFHENRIEESDFFLGVPAHKTQYGRGSIYPEMSV